MIGQFFFFFFVNKIYEYFFEEKYRLKLPPVPVFLRHPVYVNVTMNATAVQFATPQLTRYRLTKIIVVTAA